jgi:hypothetical protein
LRECIDGVACAHEVADDAAHSTAIRAHSPTGLTQRALRQDLPMSIRNFETGISGLTERGRVKPNRPHIMQGRDEFGGKHCARSEMVPNLHARRAAESERLTSGHIEANSLRGWPARIRKARSEEGCVRNVGRLDQ